MKAYADTNFFTRFYVPNPDVPRLSRMIAAYLKREDEPLPFTPLHRLEFRNAIRLMVHRRHQRGEFRMLVEFERHHGVTSSGACCGFFQVEAGFPPPCSAR